MISCNWWSFSWLAQLTWFSTYMSLDCSSVTRMLTYWWLFHGRLLRAGCRLHRDDFCCCCCCCWLKIWFRIASALRSCPDEVWSLLAAAAWVHWGPTQPNFKNWVSMIQTEIHRTRSSWRILQEAPWPDQILLDFLAVNSSVRDPVRDFDAHSKRSILACMGKARELTHQKCVWVCVCLMCVWVCEAGRL